MSGLRTGPSKTGLQVLAIPSSCIIVSFLAYFSQLLFNTSPDLAPGPLTQRQSVVFNALVICVWYTYYKACTVDPGRYSFPPSTSSSSPPPKPGANATATSTTTATTAATTRTKPATAAPRWCKKCRAPKPLRAHHCRHCGRCIPKMDHHCPWTGNCVSMQTFPYFLRFLVYSNLSLWTLDFLVVQRLSGIWSERHLPAYLGPTLFHLIALTLVSLVATAASIALAVLLYTTLRGWALNSTMIEDWEVERHEAVLARLEDEGDNADDDFWGADGASGVLLKNLNRIEFPYDLGIFANMAQAMGTRNPLLWFFPLARGPVIDTKTPGKGSGWEWEENGFNDLPGLWPPPDPEKLRRAQSGWPGAASRITAENAYGEHETPEEAKAAFLERQLADVRRKRQELRAQAQRSGILAELEEMDGPEGEQHEWEGARVWTNSEGDRLWDYGVDEEVEQDDVDQYAVPLREEEDDDDDDVPIVELIRRRRVLTKGEDG